MNVKDLLDQLNYLVKDNPGTKTLPVLLIDADNQAREPQFSMTDAYGHPALVLLSEYAQHKHTD